MEAAIAIGGLVLLVGLTVWLLVCEARSNATQRATAKTMREVIDGMERFNKARRDSRGLPRVERLAFMLQELRAGKRTSLSIDD